MSYLVGSVVSPAPIPDSRLGGKIVCCANAQIPNEINYAMARVFVAVANQLEKENRLFGSIPINCFFLEGNSFTVALEEPQRAVCMRLAIYPLPNLVPLIGTDSLYTVLAEELCHLIWDIHDETLVNFKVLEVLRNLHPQLVLADLYSETAVAECVQYAHRHPELPLSDFLRSD